MTRKEILKYSQENTFSVFLHMKNLNNLFSCLKNIEKTFNECLYLELLLSYHIFSLWFD